MKEERNWKQLEGKNWPAIYGSEAAAATTEVDGSNAIFTHAGPAHMDDLLGCAILLAHLSNHGNTRVSVARTNDAPPADAGWCVDTGSTLDIKAGRLDHHQLPSAGNGTCSIQLVAEYCGLELSPFPWAKVAGVIDCGNPAERAALVPAAWGGNPVIRYVLDDFQDRGIIKPGSRVHSMLLAIGQDVIDKCKEHTDAVARISVLNGLADARGVKSFSATTEVGARPHVEFMLVDGRDSGTVNVLKKGSREIPSGIKKLATFNHPIGFMSVVKAVDLELLDFNAE